MTIQRIPGSKIPAFEIVLILGVRFWRALFNLGHRVDNLKDPFRNSNLSCMYWSAVKGHEVSIEKGWNLVYSAGHSWAQILLMYPGNKVVRHRDPIQHNPCNKTSNRSHSAALILDTRCTCRWALQSEQVADIDFEVFITFQEPRFKFFF